MELQNPMINMIGKTVSIISLALENSFFPITKAGTYVIKNTIIGNKRQNNNDFKIFIFIYLL